MLQYGNFPDLEGVKKVLVVELRHLGDALLASPVFSVLRRALPEATIEAYVYKEAKPMLEGHPAIDGFLLYDHSWKREPLFKRLLREYRQLQQIRKRSYDCVINLTEGDRGAFAAVAARARVRVGFEPKGSWQKRLYTHIIKPTPGLRHTVERLLDAPRRIGIFPTFEERELVLHLPEEAMHAMQAKVGTEPFVLIHPTSRWRYKCWPSSKVHQLIAHLLKAGKRIVLSAGPDPIEQQMAEEVAQDLDLISVAGEISLKELGALIQLSELLICVDSVPLHMASALKKPVVALFGPTSDVTWGPWRNPYARIVAQNLPCRPCYRDGCGGSKHSDCLHTLSLAQVVAAIDRILKVHEPCF